MDLVLFLVGIVVLIVAITYLVMSLIKKDFKKKPFFILLAIGVILPIIGLSMDTPKKQPVKTVSTVKEEPKKQLPKKEEPKKEENLKRNVRGEATDLGAGTFTVGEDVKGGIYDASAESGQGNFSIKTAKGTLLANEILGNGDLGVKMARIVIGDGDSIKIAGINKVHFEPVATDIVKEKGEIALYSGHWGVGTDIGPGRYKAGENASRTSNFSVHGKDGRLKANEIISNGDTGVKEVIVNLEAGDIIKIGGSNGIKFTPQ